MSKILPQSLAGVGELRGHVASMVRVLRLPGLAPFLDPQSEHREDDGKYPEHTEREERPKEEEASAGLRDIDDSRPPQMDYGHARRNDPSDEGDDVPRSPFGEHQRAV